MIFVDAVRLEDWLKLNYKFRKVEVPEVEITRNVLGQDRTFKTHNEYAFTLEILIKKWRALNTRDLNKIIKEIKSELDLVIEKPMLKLFIELNNVSGKEIVK
jgi:hypothetical protein